MANVILGLLLLAGPQTIYTLNKHFEQGVSLFYRASLGSLRSALTGLLARGEVEFETTVERGRSKKTYRPTQAGTDAFFTWLTGPLVGSDLETAALAKLYFLGFLEDADDRRAVLDDIVQRIEHDEAALIALETELDGLDIPAEHSGFFAYQRATLAYGLASHRLGAEFFARLRDAE